MHFQPQLADAQPCWHCRHYEALVQRGSAALCTLPAAPRVRSSPQRGCSAWHRETGADDDPLNVPAVRQVDAAASTAPRR